MEDKVIVLTMYGKDNSIENISVSLFDPPRDYSYGIYTGIEDSITNYCENINSLELKGNNWIYARAIKENEKITLEIPPRFDIIKRLDDASLQKVLREISDYDVVLVLKDIDKETKEKLFRNMSKRTAFRIQEDYDAMQNVPNKDIVSAKKRVLETIFRLKFSGEICLSY